MAIKFGRPLERVRPSPIEAETPSEHRLDLAVRPRRNRRADWTRRLVREHVLTTDDLIWPLFVVDGTNVRTPVASMPDVERLSVDQAVRGRRARGEARPSPASRFSPTPIRTSATIPAREAVNAENLVCQAMPRHQERGVRTSASSATWRSTLTPATAMTALCAASVILNDATVAVLVPQALVQAEAGCDIIAPSDMMDGRVGAIRAGARRRGLRRRADHGLRGQICLGLLWAVPRRGRLSATLIGDKRTYQMDPANADEALREVELDIAEGADMVMVKPGMPYLDILRRVKEAFGMPTFAYQVSGEYAMIMAAAGNGWLDGDKAMIESLIAFKRAGADGVLTYFAMRIAEKLKKAGA